MRKLSNMNRLTLGALLAAALLATGCRSTKATLAGRFAGSEARSVYLEQVTPLAQTIIDSAALGPDGGYKFRLKDVAATPSLYNLVCNGERIPLLIAGGDRLTVNAVGSVVRNYTVDGSEETELLRQFYQPYVAGAQKLDAIAAQFARQDLAEAQRKALGKEYTAEYFRIRREQLRFIIENKAQSASRHPLKGLLPPWHSIFCPHAFSAREAGGPIPRHWSEG